MADKIFSHPYYKNYFFDVMIYIIYGVLIPKLSAMDYRGLFCPPIERLEFESQSVSDSHMVKITKLRNV